MEAADSRTTYVDNVWFLATLSRLLFTHVVDWFFKVHELEVDKNGIVYGMSLGEVVGGAEEGDEVRDFSGTTRTISAQNRVYLAPQMNGSLFGLMSTV